MKIRFIYSLMLLTILSSCSSKRNLVYFSDLDIKNNTWKSIDGRGEPVILSDDILGISVNTTSPESNLLFASTQNIEVFNGVIEKVGYRVNDEGNIKFPLLGECRLEGLTINQAQTQMEKELKTFTKNAVVNIKFINFRITVIGEVNHPSTFNVTNERINILEALGLAGDMTAYGKRENVLVIREIKKVRTMVRINLNSKEVLNSPYFYLRQNDVIYIEPDKAKSYEVSKNNKLMPLIIAGISALAILATTFINR